MSFFKKASVKRKQLWIIMTITSSALLLACACLTTFEVVTFRAGMVQNLSTLADVVGANAAPALQAHNRQTAELALSCLIAERHIRGAAIYGSDGLLLASYDRPDHARIFHGPPVALRKSEISFANGDLTLLRPVVSKGQNVGMVYVVSDVNALWVRLARYGASLALVFLATLGLALLLSNRLHRFISEPIQHLAGVARSVATEKNYSVRVAKGNPDEIGLLIDAFNDMLAQIQEHDASLEKRVRQRTARLECEIAERKHTESELARERDLLRALMDNTPSFIYFKDLKSRYIDWSKSIENCLGLPPQQIVGRTDHDFFPKECADQFLRDEQEIIRTGVPVHARIERNVSRTGKLEWLLTSKMPLRDKEGAIVGTIGISRDITAVKQAEAELEVAHRELVDASRKAGMAEVATSVLHNVGNVLNSVNVSATLVLESIAKSKLGSVQRFADLIDENKDRLPAFFAEDPRARPIPEFLNQLAARLSAEQSEWIKEIQLTRKNIEHINEIVAMQQRYARVSGIAEKINPADLIEDAVRMTSVSFDHQNIRVVRDFPPSAPPITADKHKILQILINLIRNAKYACEDSHQADKQITLQVRNGGDTIRFVVLDNGVGISPDIMGRIFNHGFTTRGDKGHGFGLHSGALAAREMGGRLSAASDGPGSGAAFTLELPLKFPATQ